MPVKNIIVLAMRRGGMVACLHAQNGIMAAAFCCGGAGGMMVQSNDSGATLPSALRLYPRKQAAAAFLCARASSACSRYKGIENMAGGTTTACRGRRRRTGAVSLYL